MSKTSAEPSLASPTSPSESLWPHPPLGRFLQLTSITQRVISIRHGLKFDGRRLALDVRTGTGGDAVRMALEGFALVGGFDLVLFCIGALAWEVEAAREREARERRTGVAEGATPGCREPGLAL